MECVTCGAEFYRRPSHAGPHCSRQCAGATRQVPILDRLHAKLDRSGGPDACWPWTGQRNRQGYGFLSHRGPGTRLVHRLAWEEAHGPVPSGLKVLHHCDYPPCANERHLFLGTIADNHADAKAKGRGCRGELTATHRLTVQQVTAIRTRYSAGGVSQHELAREYGVGAMTINRAVLRLSWAHVA